MALKLAIQVIVIFLLVAVGVWIRKKGMITEEAARMVSNFVLVIVTPSVIIQSYQRPLEPALLPAIGTLLFLAALFHGMAIVITRFVYPPDGTDQTTIRRMFAICSNCGYMGIPLITAVMGDVGSLYATLYISIFVMYTWSHGAMMLRRQKTVRFKEIVTAPGTIGAIVGMSLFFTQIMLPLPIRETLTYIGGMNTPLPTILTGVFIANITIRHYLTDWKVYLACAMRLVILPLIFIGLVWVLRVPLWFEGASQVALAGVICCSCSGALNTLLMPARFGLDTEYAGGLIAVSTVFAVVTIPGIATIAEMVFRTI